MSTNPYADAEYYMNDADARDSARSTLLCRKETEIERALHGGIADVAEQLCEINTTPEFVARIDALIRLAAGADSKHAAQIGNEFMSLVSETILKAAEQGVTEADVDRELESLESLEDA